MRTRTIGQVSISSLLLLFLGTGWTAEGNPAFREARQNFLVQIRKKAPDDRVQAIASIANFPQHEAAELILKRGVSDAHPEVRKAAQAALKQLAKVDTVSTALLEDFKRAVHKVPVTEAATELLRCLALSTDPALQQQVLKVLDDYLAGPKGNLALPITLIDDFARQADDEAWVAVKFFAQSKAFESKFGYRRCVVQALTHIQNPDAVMTLITLIPQSNGLVQHDIIQYLTKLTSQKFKDNDREWMVWWKEHQAQFEFPKGGVPAADVPLGTDQQTYYGIPVCAKRIVFVLDTSGSMRGAPIEAAKASLLQVIEKLPPEVRFDVVMFDKSAVAWQPRLMPATTQAKEDAARTIRNRGLQKGTVSFAAIETAFNLEPEAIYFLSDGQPTDSQPDQIFNTFCALNRTRRVSIHTIGVVTDRGNAAELILFMKPLAEQNFGSYRIVD